MYASVSMFSHIGTVDLICSMLFGKQMCYSTLELHVIPWPVSA